MFGNGVMTGTATIAAARKPILRDRQAEAGVFCAAARGAITQTMCVVLVASTITRTSATAMSGFVVCVSF